MTEQKRVMVSFSENDWEELQELKRKHFDLSYAEIVRMAFREGKKALEESGRAERKE